LFLNFISKELKKIEKLEDYEFSELMSKSLQSRIITNFVELNHVLLIDDVEIKNDVEFENLLNTFYKNFLFNENTKVHLKLKINLREYLIITNELFPTFVKFI
jgi:hypothetical protein